MSISAPFFKAWLRELAAVIPAFAPDFNSPDVASSWYVAFVNYQEDQMDRALSHLRDSESVFPSIARIKQVLGACGAAGESFDDLLALVRRFGSYRAPDQGVSYKLAMTINRLGGWQAVCNWTDDELPFRRKDFDDAQKASSDLLAVANPKALYPVRLLGSHQPADITPPGAQGQVLIASNEQGEDRQLERKQIDWDAIAAYHKEDLDLRVSSAAKEHGFFKLYSRPELYFRYCYGQSPPMPPYCFADIDQHLGNTRREMRGKQPDDNGRFDPQKYHVSNFKG